MLEYLFDKVLFLSLAGGVAILAVWLFCALGGKWLTCRWRYYIWLLPAILLLIPVALPTFSAPAAQSPAQVQSPVGGGLPDAPLPTAQEPVNVGTQGHVPAGTVPAAAAPAPSVRKTVDIPLLPLLWLAGIAALSLWHLIERLRFRRFARRATDPAEEWEVAVLEELRSNAGLHKTVTLRRFPGAGSPFLSGVFHPTVYLPAVELTQAELRRVLTHELTHCRRRDLAVKRLIRAVRVLHWFNPLVWLMERQVGTRCELSCDEAVVAALGHGERQEYGLTILKLMKGERSTAPVSAYLAEKEIKNRLEVIMREKHGGWARRVLAVGLSLALCLGCTALAAEVGAQNPTKIHPGTAQTGAFYDVIWKGPGEYTGYVYAAEGEAVITDTLAKKSFSASIHMDYLYPNDVPNLVNEGKSGLLPAADFQVELTRLTGVIRSRGEWTGTFTIKKNGVVVLRDEPGRIRYIPSLDGTRLTDLLIGRDGAAYFYARMNFGLAATEHVAGQAADQAKTRELINRPDTERIRISQDGEASLGSYIGAPYFHGEIYVNDILKTAALNLYIDAKDVESLRIWTADSACFTLELLPEDVTYYDGDTAKGTFYLMFPDGQDKVFRGTVTGLRGGPGKSILIRSDDGAYRLPYTITEDRTGASLNPPRGERDFEGYGEENKAEILFHESSDKRSEECVDWSEIPYEVTLDGKSVTLRYTGDPAYLSGAQLCYTVLKDKGLSYRHVDQLVGAEAVTIQLPADATGLFSLELYRAGTEPYAYMDRFTLSISCGAQGAMVTGAELYHLDNQGYTGAAAAAAIRDRLVPGFILDDVVTQ